MSRIEILPSNVADQIAAGEVVERPASIIKELVENSLDAGATALVIHIDRGGKQRIQISDNGEGMPADDLLLSIKRHATSKMHKIDDLFALHSYGFRGEALAAVASVSKLTITSRTADADRGNQITVTYGKQSEVAPVPANKGTTVLVEELFASVPARLQYLGSDRTELSHMYRIMQSFAINNPEVSFQVIVEGKTVLDYPPATVIARVNTILKIAATDLIPIDFSHNTLQITGFVSHPNLSQTSKKKQYIYVNNRAVSDWRIAHAVRETYMRTTGIPKGQHPAFVLMLTLDPLLVDVNVHPRKTEVTFAEPSEVYHLVQRSIRQTLEQDTVSVRGNIPLIDTHQESKTRTMQSTTQKLFTETYRNTYNPKYTSIVSQNSTVPKSSFSQKNTVRDAVPKQVITPMSTPQSSELTYLGQAGNRFIIAQSHEGIYLFDQHALHERQRFEKLYRALHDGALNTQTLLVPQIVDISPDEAALLGDNSTIWETVGITATVDTKSVTIYAVPTVIAHTAPEHLVSDMIQYIQNYQTGEHTLERVLRIMLEYRSCRGAIKFGDTLTPLEGQQLLDDLDETTWALLCPHGRPNFQYWDFTTLEKQFGR